MTHTCKKPKTVTAGIWQCTCNQYYIDGGQADGLVAIASFKARELLAEQESEATLAKLASRSALVKNGGYGNTTPKRSDGGEFPYDKILGLGVPLLDAEALVYWEHPSGKSYLMTLFCSESGPFQIVTNWCKKPMLPGGILAADHPRPLEGQLFQGHKAAAKLLNWANRTPGNLYNANTNWNNIVKKRRQHGYLLLRGTDLVPQFLISGDNKKSFVK